MDSRFRVELIRQTENPNQVIYAALHQDYSENFVWDETEDGKVPDERAAGELIVNRLLKGGRGHWGCLEHPHMTINAGWFPHSTMQQLRTHRVGVSFDVQSFRYTSKKLIAIANGDVPIEEGVYLRPPGQYVDRKGTHYGYNPDQRKADYDLLMNNIIAYANRIAMGFSEEHARSLVPFDVRQHWVLTGNVRSWCHMFDLRSKRDAQLECQQFCDLVWPHFKAWVPEVAQHYRETRWKRARLSP